MQHVQKACRTNRRDRNDKDNFTNQKDNLKIIGIGKHLPIITLDVNNLNLPMRRQRLGDWTENKTHSLWSLRTYLTGKQTQRQREKLYQLDGQPNGSPKHQHSHLNKTLRSMTTGNMLTYQDRSWDLKPRQRATGL